MSLPLTPERVAAVYECLREFPPFTGWRLPRPADMDFGVTQHLDLHADVDVIRDWRRLRISERRNGHFTTLAASVAHEMVHLALHRRGSPNWATHGAEFQRLAARVCARFGWDEKAF